MCQFLSRHYEPTTICKETSPFDELITSWNGMRPQLGHWAFSVRLFQKEWSPWLKLAVWGKDLQKTFHSENESFYVYQDIAKPKSGFCTGYQIEVTAEKGATLDGFHSFTACGSILDQITLAEPLDLAHILLKHIPAQSQQILPHPRAKDLCSPTSVSTAINYLNQNRSLRAEDFAEQARDQRFDIYGNWILNTAAAYEQLGRKYTTHVERVKDFSAIHKRLLLGTPVVASIKGPIKGAPLPYAQGHLILITGFDPINRKVHCMDPAYTQNEHTITSYDLDEFLKAWTGRRKNLCYIFTAS